MSINKWRRSWTGHVKNLLGLSRKSEIPKTRVLWAGPSALDGTPIMVVASCGGDAESANRKTGDMIQIAIMRQDMNPGETYNTGNDGAICPGDCAHISVQRGGLGTCYVNKARLQAAWEAAIREIESGRIGWPPGLYRGAYLRFGMDGDPSAAPLTLWEALATECAGYTGYTANWRSLPERWRFTFMASCQTVADAERARSMGWRTFTTTKNSREDAAAPGIQCHADRPNVAISCLRCRLCDGAARGVNVPSIWIPIHGAKGATLRE